MRAWHLWVLLDETGRPWCYLGTAAHPVTMRRRFDARMWRRRLKTKRGGKYRIAKARVTVSEKDE